MKLKPKLLFLFVLICANSWLQSTTWHIKQDGSGDFITIQEGIDASVYTDTVLVYPGTYYENLDFNGRDIVLASLELTTGNEQYIVSTVIDGQRQGSCIRIHNGETNAYIQGFTIQNGFGTHFWSNDGGGVLVHDYSTVYITNCVIKDNLAAVGGGIHARHGFLNLSGVKIIENSASVGGAIYLVDDSTVDFDPDNCCNIYNNNAGKGADLYIKDTGHVEVIVDTFSVFEPSRYFAEYLDSSTYTFDIQNNWMVLEPNDLYVAEDGDDTNSGLSPGEPLKNISWAVRKIQADSLNPRIVHVAAGTYSHEINQQIYPIGCKEYVSIIGEDIENTILCNDYTLSTLLAKDLDGELSVENFQIINISEYYSFSIFNFFSSGKINLKNIKVSDNSNIQNIARLYQVNTDIDNLIITNNTARDRAGLSMHVFSANVNNVKVANNTSYQTIGYSSESALYLYASGDVLFDNCQFSNNISYNQFSNTIRTAGPYFEDHLMRMSNSLISENETINDRIFYVLGDGNNEFINCTFADNTSSNTTIKSEANVTLTNCIMHNNTDHEIYMAMDTVLDSIYTLNVDHCNIKSGEEGIYNQGNAAIINWGDGNIEEYPLFLLSGDNPYQLALGSPCVDTGTPDTTGLFLPPWDLLHNQRVWDGDGDGIAIIDMGCYEFNSEPYAGIHDDEIPVVDYQLTNFPNPFNPETKIVFDLPEPGQVKLEIYNIKGQKVKTLLDCYMSPGRSEMLWNSKDDNGKRVSSGVYFYRLQTPTKVLTKKMMLLK
ncbi:MAG: right-handed parallel beta-helix repeat-containing protein [Candidatus Tenebribacter mawsonii]|nr:right-handed parallel beta-helix repeat-containing protein [Candidatus Tenebribacter mawsonii]